MSPGERFLVLGATGFFGSHITEELRTAGQEVVPAARDGVKGPSFDLLDPAGMRKLLSSWKPNCVINAAGASSPAAAIRDPAGAFLANASGTLNLLEAIRQETPDALLLSLSSAAVYSGGPPFTEESETEARTPYSASKLSAEIICEQYVRWAGARVAIVRCFNLTGPGEPSGQATSEFCRAARQAKPGDSARVQVGDPAITRDITDVRDAARAVKEIGVAGLAGTYNICSAKPRSLASIAETISEVSGRHLELASSESRRRSGEAPASYGSAELLRKATGWEPVISFRQSMTDLLGSIPEANSDGGGPNHR